MAEQDYRDIAEKLAHLLLGARKIKDFQGPDGLDYEAIILHASEKKQRSSKAKPSVSTEDGFTLTAPRAKAAAPASTCQGPWAEYSKEELGAFMQDFIKSGTYNLKYKGWDNTHPQYWREAVSTLRRTMAKIDAGDQPTAAGQRCLDYWDAWVRDRENQKAADLAKINNQIQQTAAVMTVEFGSPVYLDILAASKLNPKLTHKVLYWHQQKEIPGEERETKFWWLHADHPGKQFSAIQVALSIDVEWSNNALATQSELINKLTAAKQKKNHV